ncbi:FMN-dependent dehydrogenase [Mariannaea sp. PMI_226]|nr:FMN-dependent dehydrogenase [Mariannaea sp. PMI_226]
MSDLSAMESETPNIPPPRTIELPKDVPPLEEILCANDFALAAEKALSPKAWAFYSSAATDMVTFRRNKEIMRRIMLRPRILRNVSNVNIERNILGLKSKAPFFMCPAAMATLAHPDGELGWSRAVANEGIFEIISSNASYALPTIIGAAPPGYPFFLQLYVNSNRQKTVELLRRARSLGIKAIFVTVDAAVPGKREADERIPQATPLRSEMSGGTTNRDGKGNGLGRLMGQYIDKALEWSDLEWIKRESSVPIVLKGVQTVEDVRLAVEHGVEGVVLSNHGGRSLDGSPASMLILLEVRKQFPAAFQHLQVFIDGGFERGSDILKAIALGATAVGIARPFLYSLVYGQKGVEHLSQILKDELETSMRLAGITSLDQASAAMVNTLDVDYMVPSGGTESCTVAQFPRASKL